MSVDVGSNCNAFFGKHLFYVLFFRTTFVKVYGGSTFQAAGVVLVPVNLPGSKIIHPLYLSYLTPTDHKKLLSLSTFKIYSGFLCASHESLCSFKLHEYQVITFTINTTHKRNLNYIDLHVANKYQSNPLGPHLLLSPIIMRMRNNISVQFTYQRFGHASNKSIQKMSIIGVYTGTTKYILKLLHHCRNYVIYKGTCIHCNTNVST